MFSNGADKLKVALYTSLNEYTGIGNYTRQLFQAMHQSGYSEIELLSESARMDKRSIATKLVSGLRRLYLEQVKFPNILYSQCFELYHNTQNLGVPLRKVCPTVVTIHDIVPLVYPQRYLPSYIEKFVYTQWLKVSVKKSDHIITDSKFSKAELIKHLQVDANKITVTYLGYNQHLAALKDNYRKESICQKYGITKPYIMALGGSEYRKNISSLVSAFRCQKLQDFQLLLVGSGNEQYSRPEIITATKVDESDLACLYRYATVFVFPSFYEGFGLPILEAMSVGTPVVTSQTSSLPEVGGDAAVYFDPFNIDDMRNKILSVLFDQNLRAHMIQEGYEQIQNFSWEKCAEETVNVYRMISGKNKGENFND